MYIYIPIFKVLKVAKWISSMTTDHKIIITDMDSFPDTFFKC